MKPAREDVSSTQPRIHPLHLEKGQERSRGASPGNTWSVTECHGWSLVLFSLTRVAGNCSGQALTYWPHEYTFETLIFFSSFFTLTPLGGKWHLNHRTRQTIADCQWSLEKLKANSVLHKKKEKKKREMASRAVLLHAPAPLVAFSPLVSCSN